MSKWKPPLSLFNVTDNSFVNEHEVNFGFVQPGSYTIEKELELWNNRAMHIEQWQTLGAWDLTKPGVIAVNVSFPDANNVTVDSVSSNGVEDAWVQFAVYDWATLKYGAYTTINGATKMGISLKGTHFDPFDATQPHKKSARFKLRLIVPPTAEQNKEYKFQLVFGYTEGTTDPAGPGATNYADIG